MIRPCSVLRISLAVALVVVLLPALGSSKEESKIQVRLENADNGNGNGNGIGKGQIRGDLRLKLQGSVADLQLRTRGLEPGDYVLVARDEMDEEHVITSFTAGSNGSANVRVDLTDPGDSNDAPIDPRGKYISVRPDDGMEIPETDDVLGAWVYGDADLDPKRTKVKELTALEPNAPSIRGHVEARYDMRPQGRGTLVISLRGLEEGTYEVAIPDEGVATELVTNSGGNARVTYATRARNGNSANKGHNKRELLSFDPRREHIEIIRIDGAARTLYFSGPMIAQIEGLNSCTAGIRAAAQLVDPADPNNATRSGHAELEIEDDCETSLEVEVVGLVAPATYDVYADDAPVGPIDVVDDGGIGRGAARFDPTPDDPDELPLDVEVSVGSEIRVFAAGADPSTELPLLSGVLE